MAEAAPDHVVTVECDETQAYSKGLTTARAEELRSRFGLNKLEEKAKPKWKLYIEQFIGPMPCVIWAAVIIELALALRYGQTWIDFGVLCGIQLLNGHIAFYEAYTADDAVAALKSALQPSVFAKRDGAWRALLTAELVPGDLVKLSSGATVPADCKLNDDRVQVDNSSLTGESQPVPVNRDGSVMMGSTVVRGEAEATVVCTGAKTVMGRTASLIGSVDAQPRFARVLLRVMGGLIALSLVVVCTVLGFLMRNEKQQFSEAIGITVILLVVSVPLALTVVTTSTMAIGSPELSKEGAIVSRLSAIEELAGVTILCSDKTGTLTLNKMALQKDTPLFDGATSQAEVLKIAALASRWMEPPKDALDTLVLNAVDKASLDGYDSLEYTPFDAAVKRTQQTVVERATGARFRAAKGAPHAIFSLLQPAAHADRDKAEAATDRLAERGIRALAVAKADGDAGGGPERLSPEKGLAGACCRCKRPPYRSPPSQFVLVGLLSFLDPPQPDSADTLRRVLDNGLMFKMLTGDSVAIARETARQLGVGTNVVEATADLPALGPNSEPPPDLERFVPSILNADGFAKVFPEHKFLVVEALRRSGQSVAMTGDGVNDAPALKRADVGICVQGATDAARAAAAIVLTRPGISTILTALLTSRRIFFRIEVYILYRLACTLQILIFFFIGALSFVRYHTYLDFTALAVFGPDGRPNGALMLFASAASCSQATWPLAEIAAAAGPSATGVTASSLAAGAAAGRGAADALAATHGVDINVAANTVSGPVCVEQWPRTFMLPLIALIIITVLNDGAIISIAHDRVKPANHPVQWRLLRVTLLACVLSGIMLASSLTFLHLMLSSHYEKSPWRVAGLPPVGFGQICSAIWLQISISNVFTLVSARTTSFAFTRAPSVVLLVALCCAVLVSSILTAFWPLQLNEHAVRVLHSQAFRDQSIFKRLRSAIGVRMDPAPSYLIGAVYIFCLIWWAVQDSCKVATYRLLAWRDRRRGASAAVPAREQASGSAV